MCRGDRSVKYEDLTNEQKLKHMMAITIAYLIQACNKITEHTDQQGLAHIKFNLLNMINALIEFSSDLLEKEGGDSPCREAFIEAFDPIFDKHHALLAEHISIKWVDTPLLFQLGEEVRT